MSPISTRLLVLVIGFSIFGCDQKENSLFNLLGSDITGIEFSNELYFREDFNIFKYRNYYNGGGVGLADVNGDGLLDIYLVSNLSSNKLYINKGNLKFSDATEVAGVGGKRAWSTGVSMADIDGDGLTDIYVCNSGDISGDNKQNELFINNGDGTFTEKAEELGLADRGFSTHAAFFDYDKDGDLDVYLLNNSYQAIGSFNLRKNERPIRDEVGGDKLYMNDDGVFKDVSVNAGIYGSVIGFGLGVTVGDVNRDGWQDIYVSNDFFERDYLYINNQKGGFIESLTDQMKAVSAASMGADMGDLNNDGYPEIFVTDMLPGDNERIKTVTTFDSWDRYQYSVTNGYWHQFTRNTLHFNNGDNSFSELGRFSGVEASDWSWGALIFDFENDGYKDIFVANGIYQDLTNQDFLQYAMQEDVTKKVTSGGGVDYETLINYMPSVPISNHAYVNNRDLTFSNSADVLGLDKTSFSSGSAYGDLDNDGDLDLVINNTNMPFFLYENTNEKHNPDNNYIRFVLTGTKGNTNALGTNITVFIGDSIKYLEHLPTRGFQSTVDNRPLIGLGSNEYVDSIHVKWPNLTTTILKEVKSNQDIILNESEGIITGPTEDSNPSQFKEINSLEFEHQENPFVDFDRDRLLFQMRSTLGPCLCKGDINNDGLDDVFIGGAAEQAGTFALQLADGTFREISDASIAKDSLSEDVDCQLFDANGDGLMDLYVVSGGNEFEPADPRLADRLYFQTKNGFEKVRKVLPANKYEVTSTISVVDFDQDGDEDIFVGGHLQSYNYGSARSGYILKNDGVGNFENVSDKIAPDLRDLGMITDGEWVDFEGDGDYDLVVVGEWMPITIFVNEGNEFNTVHRLPNSSGWWNDVAYGDFNGDGLMDIVAGNHGLNSRFETSSTSPLTMFVEDFDRNGTIEQIICQYEGEKLFPLPLRHDLGMQLPGIKKRYLKYDSYKDQEITDIFSKELVESAQKLTVQELETVLYMNQGNLTFAKKELPPSVQFSTVHEIVVEDLTGDNNLDILFGGNLYNAKPEMGRYDASYGVYLKGDGNGSFQEVSVKDSGLKLDKQVRGIEILRSNKRMMLIVANNDDRAQVFTNSKE